MDRVRKPVRVVAAAAVLAVGAAAADAATVRVKIENVQGEGGFSLTPLYVALHDGTFDAFSRGDPATPGVELLAELGVVSGLPPERLAADPESTAAVITQPANGPPTIDPGEIGEVRIDVDTGGGEQRFLTYLSMIVPSNDQFIGNGDPLAFEIFQSDGTFNGPTVIEVTGLNSYDAGTEINDPADGPAFVLGVDATLGTPENGVITQGVFSLDPFLGLETPAGIISRPLDIVDDLGGSEIARITVSQVPLPAAAPFLATALGGLALVRLRRRRTA
jgi:hypothetical protein